jgi:hypothetical protein
MRTLGDAFVARLHVEHLKPLGFKKTRHTFVRAHAAYAEHYQVQGSAWNNKDGPWTCYLNCGISFNGLPPRSPDRDFPRTHAWMRAGRFAKGARSQYDVTADNMLGLVEEIAGVIRECSNYFEARHGALRHAYEQGRYERGFLADTQISDAP